MKLPYETFKIFIQSQLLKKQVRKMLPKKKREEEDEGRRKGERGGREGGREERREGQVLYQENHSFQNYLEKELDSFVT